ncbi:hypothetical protein ACFXKG_18295 [Streptomyces sp. NPDC059255]|uniref:hypothetical protein n=1 Tax=Streptomyces sp. NPDC059255 TaxID=3346793 RepID=UPI003673B042
MAEFALFNPVAALLITGMTAALALVAIAGLAWLLAHRTWRLVAPATRIPSIPAPSPAPADEDPAPVPVRYLPCHSTRCAHLTTRHTELPGGGWVCTTRGCGRIGQAPSEEC